MFLARFFASSSYLVRGGSMLPALADGQRVLVDTRAYRHAPPARGDTVVFRHRLPGQRRPVTSVKRVVGLPGEHVHIKEGRVHINGTPLGEPHAWERTFAAEGMPGQWVLDQGQVFLLGDNREDSYDSRRLGPVESAHIVGRVWLRCWPLSRWGRVPGTLG